MHDYALRDLSDRHAGVLQCFARMTSSQLVALDAERSQGTDRRKAWCRGGCSSVAHKIPRKASETGQIRG